MWFIEEDCNRYVGAKMDGYGFWKESIGGPQYTVTTGKEGWQVIVDNGWNKSEITVIKS